jgi:hypothetical protein
MRREMGGDDGFSAVLAGPHKENGGASYSPIRIENDEPVDPHDVYL